MFEYINRVQGRVIACALGEIVKTVAIAAALFAVPTFALLPASAQVAGYPDVSKTHWAADSITHLAVAGIIQKKSATPLGGAPKPMTTTAPTYDGNKPVTRYELAVTLYRFVQYIEHANAQRKTKFGAQAQPSDGPTAVKLLIAKGYLPVTTPLAKDGDKAVTANQMADALAAIITKSREKATPISPDLKEQPAIEKPAASPRG